MEERMLQLDGGGEVYTMREWIDKVETDQFTDRDGHGYYCNGNEYLVGRNVYPSLLERGRVDTHWSHIYWVTT